MATGYKGSLVPKMHCCPTGSGARTVVQKPVRGEQRVFQGHLGPKTLVVVILTVVSRKGRCFCTRTTMLEVTWIGILGSLETHKWLKISSQYWSVFLWLVKSWEILCDKIHQAQMVTSFN